MYGDGDWAPTIELLRRSTSGGAVRMLLVVRQQEVCSAMFTCLKRNDGQASAKYAIWSCVSCVFRNG